MRKSPAPASQSTPSPQLAQTPIAKAPITKAPEQKAAEVDLSALFYGLLFSQQAESAGGTANNLERKVMGEIEAALSSVKCIADTTLKLPSKIIELDKKLANEDIDTKEVLALIEQDPLLSVEVLKLCNSPAFRRSDSDITNLQQALVQLGRVQLRRFVTASLSREMIDIKPIYFRRFGAEIWRHSMQVAFLASELAEEDNESAFLLGLLHDVGKIAIFKLLIDAFHQAEPGEQPRSLLFSQVMTTKSLTLSALLAREWQLPISFAKNLALLANTNNVPQQGLARVIWQANIISECSMLRQANKLSGEALEGLMQSVGLDTDAFEQLHQKLIEF
ncbi:HDOD domain-containing protein [Shewanella maritima]|uniref:HDOD domain-containing protein n=1 Tax=Shewanella maritima TaxID=2520507 RepID=A0A411PHI9_9GAMM|nr:HDOD domain-containing protein [Shewanella maritima]QBF83057.1 HDOD domain-containing protein [Shewanella maritima]